ncbi:MAG: rod shape-determining protein MreC [Gaiellaceae bacterium]
MPRNRSSARVAALGAPIRRTVAPSYSSRQTGPLKRRIVVGLLVLASLAMITVYFREAPSGGLHDMQSAAATAMRPFEIGAQRISRPFRDAYGWVAGLFHAKSENERLREELEQVRAQAIIGAELEREYNSLADLLKYRRGDTFPQDFPRSRAVAASVLSNPAGEFEQKIIVAAGSSDGIRVYDAVVTADGLVGHVSKVLSRQAEVTMLTDPASGVTARALPMASDNKTGAIGILRHGEGSALFLDRVPKQLAVKEDYIVVTAGSGQGPLGSFFPRGIPIGKVTSVGQTDVASFKDVQVQPFVDFSDLATVLILVAER